MGGQAGHAEPHPLAELSMAPSPRKQDIRDVRERLRGNNVASQETFKSIADVASSRNLKLDDVCNRRKRDQIARAKLGEFLF
jgi:hypothetical protein